MNITCNQKVKAGSTNRLENIKKIAEKYAANSYLYCNSKRCNGQLKQINRKQFVCLNCGEPYDKSENLSFRFDYKLLSLRVVKLNTARKLTKEENELSVPDARLAPIDAPPIRDYREVSIDDLCETFNIKV